MRMQKEEKIVIVLLLMALGSLAVANWAFGTEGTGESAAKAKGNSQITLEGLVLEKKPTKTGGHLVIKLDSTSMPIFVPRDSGAEDMQSRINIGDRIKASGIATEFGGKEELKVGRGTDVEVI